MSLVPELHDAGEAPHPLAGASASTAVRLTPLALLGSPRARRVLERNFLVYRRMWLMLVSGFFEPFFYLLSIGLGLNHLVGPVTVNGEQIPYAAFVAPGLLAASAMNGAFFDATFNTYFKLKVARTYEAILSTPLGVGDVALGDLSWSLCRGALYSAAFLVVMTVLGYTQSPWAILCFPCAVLVSYAFGGAGMAGTTYMRSWQDFDILSMIVLPLFLFSGTFYPITLYPTWLEWVVRVTPLYQGVALLRAVDLGDFSFSLLGHVLYLAVMGTAGLMLTSRRLARLLLP